MQEKREDRIALVYMPWGSVSHPSIAIGILKECARTVGFTTDVHYLNLRFAELVGLETYESISSSSALFPEWFFATSLFGIGGLNVMANSWEDLNETESGRAVSRKIDQMTNNSPSVRERIERAVPAYIKSCLTEIDWSIYLAVGFSVTFAQTAASLMLARQIKLSCPSVSIIFGGANVEAEMGIETIRAFPWIDYVVHGEGERALPQLLCNLAENRRFDPVAGVSLRKNGAVLSGMAVAALQNLDESPTPDYDDYFHEIRHRGLDKKISISLPLESSRGCWWGAKQHCTFCGLNGDGMPFRRKSAARVYRELIDVTERYQCLVVNYTDNILDMQYFRDVLPMIAEAELDISIFYEVKANLSRDHVRMLAASGVTKIQPGIESFDSELLRMMRKGITGIQNIQLLKWCAEFGIEPMWNLLYGFPGETSRHYEDLPRLLRTLFHLRPPVGVCPIVFERFSPYHFDSEQFALQLSPTLGYESIFPSSMVDLRQLAYYFDGSWPTKDCCLKLIPPIREAFREWTNVWESRNVFCYFEKGPDFIVIYDSRPLNAAAGRTMQRATLTGVKAQIYSFCEEIRSYSAIVRQLLGETPSDEAQRRLRHLLDDFVELGFMATEQDRYLSLAVRKNPTRKYLRHAVSLGYSKEGQSSGFRILSQELTRV
jgi:ribosomal peptide maturation radical SAM protein 1